MAPLSESGSGLQNSVLAEQGRTGWLIRSSAKIEFCKPDPGTEIPLGASSEPERDFLALFNQSSQIAHHKLTLACIIWRHGAAMERREGHERKEEGRACLD
ncbi:MAG: hypothetical protein GX575_09735 [Candidatus Anammoximicrobium sp.]|nr:hypothetical protein [Candidatus Anammoximicrobium sp.]